MNGLSGLSSRNGGRGLAQQPKISDEELNEHFREQVAALASSCANYDAGQRWEAKRIASAVYILCHDPPFGHKSKSKSLLSQMNLKTKLDFISTANHDAAQVVPGLPLAAIASTDTDGTIYVPSTKANPVRPMRFRLWYEETVFYAGKRELSRKNLILSMRSQDGGAHIDDIIKDAEYQQLRLDNDTRVRRKKWSPGGEHLVLFDLGAGFPPERDMNDFEPVPFAHFATMRQIGYEVLQSVGRLL